ncbi:MarR family winged helix-turn-helix transcriptional regulator (plasmid) [Coraliomargarita sp. W4R53]
MNTENNTSEEPVPRQPPLGYWLRIVDGLISNEFATTLDAENVSRREWMLLNALDGDVNAPGLAERLARKGKHLHKLSKRGWATEQADGTWMLTDDGRATKARLGEVVSGIRSRVAGAVSPEDYATTVASLEAIARELGWDESEPGRFGRRGWGRRGFGGRGGLGGGRHGRHRHHGHGHGHGHGCHGDAVAAQHCEHHRHDHSNNDASEPRPAAPDIHHTSGPNLHHGFDPRTPGV